MRRSRLALALVDGRALPAYPPMLAAAGVAATVAVAVDVDASGRALPGRAQITLTTGAPSASPAFATETTRSIR